MRRALTADTRSADDAAMKENETLSYASRRFVVEERATLIQRELWRSRQQRDDIDELAEPLSVLEPGVALKELGYKIRSEHTLGQMIHQGRRVEVAGMIDCEQKVVSISNRFPPQERLYTAAHELGHAVLHPADVILHRDRPLDPLADRKEPLEREADWFSAFFLMPEKQVRAWFARLFLTDRFVLNDATAFALCTKPRCSFAVPLSSRADVSVGACRLF